MLSSMKLIKQSDPKFANIKFKNNTSLSAYGCCIMSVSMIIKYYLGDNSDTHTIVKQVVEICTNENGDFIYPNDFKICNVKFGCEIMALEKPKENERQLKFDVSAEIDKGNAVVIRVQTGTNMHYVTCNQIGTRGDINTYKILDPGFGCNTIGELMVKYKERFDKKGLGVKITKKFMVIKK